jgi:serine/threonine-protein phosphatase 2A regulatory subunit B
MAAAAPLEWKLAQSFGDKHHEDIEIRDHVSALEFNDDGTLLAIGDRGGRIKVLQRNVVAADRTSSSGAAARPSSVGMGAPKDSAWFRRAGTPAPPSPSEPSAVAVHYREVCEFKSHDPEFDYLKSLEIEEKINCISWLKRSSRSMSLLTTNDKTIKLWKVKARDAVPQKSALTRRPSADSLFPTPAAPAAGASSFARRIYANGHAYHINSISTSSDCEHFISADDLRLNLWNFEVSDTAFNIVDIKPSNMEDLTEVITSACFHPEACSVFAWANSRGAIRLSDMRGQALCDLRAKVFQEADDPSRRSFFSEIISSISDVKFSSDGR